MLDLSDGLDFFKSVDSVSVTLAQLLFAGYLVMALILLINMLIALLSNTYQRVQVNLSFLACSAARSAKFADVCIETGKGLPVICTNVCKTLSPHGTRTICLQY